MNHFLIFIKIQLGSLIFASLAWAHDIHVAVPDQVSWRVVRIPASRNIIVAEGVGPVSNDLKLEKGKYLFQTLDNRLWVTKQEVLERPEPISLKSLTTSAQPYVIELNPATEATKNDYFQVKIIDADGFSVFHKVTPDKRFQIPLLPPGKYKLYAASVVFVNDELKPPQKWEDVNLLRSSKYLSSNLDVASAENLKIVKVEPVSPLGRVNYDGRNISFAWMPTNGARSYQVEMQPKDKQRLMQTIFKVEGKNFDDTILHALQVGNYKYKITALDSNGELYPLVYGFGEFNWQAPYLNPLRPRSYMAAGTNLSISSYNAKSESFTQPGSQFDSQDFGFFFSREENDGKEVKRLDLQSNIISFKSKTMLWANLQVGKGTSDVTSDSYRVQKMWNVQYISVPEVLSNFTFGGLIRSQTQFLGPSYRYAISKSNKEFTYEGSLSLGLPLLNQPAGLNFQSAVGSYTFQAAANAKVGLYWPWSLGAQIDYNLNSYKYKNDRNSDPIVADYNLTEFKFFIDYEM